MTVSRAKDRLPEEKVFKDPVHKYIYVQDELIWNLINTREFQRLRRIRQLGTSYLTFHGAEHSRFSHSLGVYEITRKIISQFERSGYPGWPKEEKLVALCAALLHDVGHGPFSHSIEDVFDTHHEAWTCRILLEDTEINQVLREYDASYPERVAAVICKSYHEPIVVSLVSSQMDADRMDYLLRDAYYTGVNYGTFDLERILRVLRPYQGQIVVKESGMHAVEDYLMSRYQMYWQVYFHPVTRSSEIILKQIFRRAKELHGAGYAFTWMMSPLEKLISGTIDIEDYVALDEALVQTAFSAWAGEPDAVLSDLCRRFLNRRLYKYITMDQADEKLWQEIRSQFSAVGLHPEYHLEIDFPYDMPYHVYRPGSSAKAEKEEKPPILLLSGEDQLSEISGRSDIVRSITGIHQGKYHLYYPEEPLRESAHRLSANIRELFALM
ncbi:HD domain-containing protein [Paenibacillus sacheonensis]|uniref:HD domain-containing protein n=1 Tax=Paenibacillus sacheonensis TaxID=742054 RepID=A0A7X4YXD9_9BACL|nr:HD domain-containing protein [Paenibacillus sacheonensis]MBM7569350.1 HD superfamily phosphohydrolase [Paenibacillus sacheonensis]NBC73341.1 HD domain-containing protein [Paenibacillus sacheonensis]